MLHADYRIPSLDYIDLLKLCRYITSDMEEVKKLFRQMVFNVVIENKDDHAKKTSPLYIQTTVGSYRPLMIYCHLTDLTVFIPQP